MQLQSISEKEIMQKKSYSTPKVVVYGNVAELTRQGGGSFLDVPIGTSTSSPGGVTGNLS